MKIITTEVILTKSNCLKKLNFRYLNLLRTCNLVFGISSTAGFTYVELILYTAIVSLVMVSLILFAWNVIGGGVKSSTEEEVYSQARYLSERVKYEIRNASDVNFALSNFGTNLATNSVAQLYLVATGSANPVVFNVANGYLRVSVGASSPVALNSNDTKITNLTFTNYTSADSKTKNIQFTLSISSNFPNAGLRQEYYDSATLESDAELRSN